MGALAQNGLTKRNAEAVVQRCTVKKVFLKISQNSQENTCARVSFLICFCVTVCNVHPLDKGHKLNVLHKLNLRECITQLSLLTFRCY